MIIFVVMWIKTLGLLFASQILYNPSSQYDITEIQKQTFYIQLKLDFIFKYLIFRNLSNKPQPQLASDMEGNTTELHNILCSWVRLLDNIGVPCVLSYITLNLLRVY